MTRGQSTGRRLAAGAALLALPLAAPAHAQGEDPHLCMERAAFGEDSVEAALMPIDPSDAHRMRVPVAQARTAIRVNLRAQARFAPGYRDSLETTRGLLSVTVVDAQVRDLEDEGGRATYYIAYFPQLARDGAPVDLAGGTARLTVDEERIEVPIAADTFQFRFAGSRSGVQRVRGDLLFEIVKEGRAIASLTFAPAAINAAAGEAYRQFDARLKARLGKGQCILPMF